MGSLIKTNYSINMTDTTNPNLHLMFDIETLSNQPNAVMFAIGAAEFDITTGEIFNTFYELIDFSYGDNEPAFNKNASTIAWWCSQNEEATKELVRATTEGKGIWNVLYDLQHFVSNSKATKYWAKGQFDFPILNYHYSFFSETLKPLNYRKLRDMRTTLDEAEINPKDYPNVGAAHNALDDCKFQITCLVDAWKRVTSWKNAS